MPKVSVVIPAYNCEKFISMTIESILGQTYKDYEIIVVNDGSTDKTDEILSKYAPKIKKIYQPNKGPAEARNTGVSNAEGEYVAFLDQDDAWFPDKLKMQVELLEKNDGVGLVYTDMYIVDDAVFESSGCLSQRVFQMRQPRRGPVLEHLFLENFIPTSSVMVRKKCLLKVGVFDSSVVPSEDYDMWLRIAANYEVDYIDIPMAKYRNHIACFRKNKIVTVTHIINVLNRALSEYPFLRDRLGKKADQKISYYYITLGNTYFSKMLFREAFHNFYMACKLKKSPFLPFYIIFSSIFEGVMNILRLIKSKIVQRDLF